MSVGTELWKREGVDGWWRIGLLSTTVTAANAHRVYIEPCKTASETGDLYVYGAALLDVAIAGGYVRTDGTAIAYDGSAPQEHILRVPLQGTLRGGALWRSVVESADKRAREVVTVGTGVRELAARIRYDESPQELNDLLRAGVMGFPLVYIPDDSDLDIAVECELIEPGADWTQEADVDWQAFREPSVAIRLRRMDGGDFSALP